LKVNFLTDNKVEVVLEIKSTYNKNASERKIFGNSYALGEFAKVYPDKKVERVLVSSELDNFSKTGTFSGTWVFELEEQKVLKPIKKQTPKTRKRKNKIK
jgi:transglutaminase/protease-like cytokinesis protein 3